MASENKNGTSINTSREKPPLICGLIMPISTVDGCTADHWTEVKEIITEAIQSIDAPKFTVNLVSDADDVGVIQKRIVQNVYSSDVVVCDVSGKNPNVMFELGLRLAFDKPTVIVKDDKTDYSFDTGIIEHVGYPRDLRFNRIVGFKSLLADKVLATYSAAKKDPNHSTFLKNFGKFHVVSLNQDEVHADRAVVEMFSELQSEIVRLRHFLPRIQRNGGATVGNPGLITLGAEVKRYFIENPEMDPSQALKNEDFIDQMEARCDAPKHFSGPVEFKAALSRAVRQLTS